MDAELFAAEERATTVATSAVAIAAFVRVLDERIALPRPRDRACTAEWRLLVHAIMNAIELLKQQHTKTKDTLEKMHESGGTPAQVKQIADELVAHMVIEEHIFYPKMKEIMGDEMWGESFEEHAVARFELARLLQATGEDVKTRAGVLKEIIEHHVEEEEEEMFPKVEKKVDAEQLELLGMRMKAAFDNAVARGFDACIEPLSSDVAA